MSLVVLLLFILLLVVFVLFIIHYCGKDEMIYDYCIISAFNLELQEIIDRIKIVKIIKRLERNIYIGTYKGKKLILCLTGQGLVNAALTCQYLIENFKFDKLIFSGIAGGIADYLQLGDIVVGSSFAQIDYSKLSDETDEKPNFPQPYVGIQFECENNFEFVMETEYFDKQIVKTKFLYDRNTEIPQIHNKPYNIYTEGIVLSSSQFVGNPNYVEQIKGFTSFNFVAVDMESSSIANVCLQNKKKFAIIRAISDKADTGDVEDIQKVVKNVVDYVLTFITY